MKKRNVAGFLPKCVSYPSAFKWIQIPSATTFGFRRMVAATAMWKVGVLVVYALAIAMTAAAEVRKVAPVRAFPGRINVIRDRIASPSQVTTSTEA